MKILCKHKDFYDYKCHEYGHDPFPTFDRRRSLQFKDEFIDKYKPSEVLTQERLDRFVLNTYEFESI